MNNVIENTKTSIALTSFPKTPQELLSMRINKKAATLNDAVERALIANINDEVLSGFLSATSDDESQTGKWRFDNFLAARHLKVLAKDPVISSEKDTTVQRSMGVVLRRFGLGVDQRRKALPAPISEPSEM